ncbi:MAG: hypothetical protein R6V85_18420 [Polyangia bacterium]
MLDQTTEKERVEESTEEQAPRILEAEAADRGEKPNTCRYCAGSKFC